ncbi:hypothetical protein TNCV_2209921 [Trichonephila clavipes]|nr:hypothetical protein TNCV_2209921 [Trichonephila clavipes]
MFVCPLMIASKAALESEKIASPSVVPESSRWVEYRMNASLIARSSLLLDIMIVKFRNEKVSNHGSIPITIDCNVVAFIVFEEGFHQPIKRTKQSVSLDVTVFRHTLVD